MASHPGTPPGATPAKPAPPMNPLAPGELPRHSDTTLPLTVRTVIKLDQRSMVWAYDGIATQVEAMAPFLALLFTALLVGWTWAMFAGARELLDIDLLPRLSLWGGWILFVIGGSWFIGYLLKISLFNTYGDLHFNRKTGKIYTAENNKALIMDWRYVRPEAALGFGPSQLGGPPLMSLVLVEYEPNQPTVWKTRIGVAGLLPNREGCQQVWELIRRYMEEPPEALPKLEVAQGGRNWTSALIEFGPLVGFRTPGELLARLRSHNWRPGINPLLIPFWIACWPDPLSVILYARYRRRAKLPAEWTQDETPVPGEPNPYNTAERDPAEVAGRRKAAWTIGVTCGICILIGTGCYAFAAWAVFFSGR